MNRRKYLHGAFLTLLAASVGAGDASYESLPIVKAPKAREPGVIYRLLSTEHQSILGVTLLANAFSDVTKRFNTTAPEPVPGFTHGKGVCISAAQPGDPTKVVFVSIPIADLHGFVLYSGAGKERMPARCMPSAEVQRQMKTPGGVHLGMTKSEVVRLFGKPTAETANMLRYRFEMLKKFTPKEWFEAFLAQNQGVDPAGLYTLIRTDIKLELVDDRLVSYAVSSTDTY